MGTSQNQAPLNIHLYYIYIYIYTIYIYSVIYIYIWPALVLCPKFFWNDCREPHFW